jgi:hypothetical protein
LEEQCLIRNNVGKIKLLVSKKQFGPNLYIVLEEGKLAR